MNMKVLLGGVLAGIAMFLYSSVIHAASPVGTWGTSAIANEDAVMAAIKANVTQPGFYFIPGMDMEKAKTMPKEQFEAAYAALEKKWAAGPSGILIVHPQGDPGLTPQRLIYEFLSDVVCCWIVAFVLAMSAGSVRSFVGRVAYITFLGLLPYVSIEFSYYNWYGFPAMFEAAQLIDQVGSFLTAGLVLAFMWRKA